MGIDVGFFNIFLTVKINFNLILSYHDNQDKILVKIYVNFKFRVALYSYKFKQIDL